MIFTGRSCSLKLIVKQGMLRIIRALLTHSIWLQRDPKGEENAFHSQKNIAIYKEGPPLRSFYNRSCQISRKNAWKYFQHERSPVPREHAIFKPGTFKYTQTSRHTAPTTHHTINAMSPYEKSQKLIIPLSEREHCNQRDNQGRLNV